MTDDVDAVLARRDRFASSWYDNGQVVWLDQAGITLVRGHGRLTAPRTVAVVDPTSPGSFTRVGATERLSSRTRNALASSAIQPVTRSACAVSAGAVGRGWWTPARRASRGSQLRAGQG
jgi:hypothetical protein